MGSFRDVDRHPGPQAHVCVRDADLHGVEEALGQVLEEGVEGGVETAVIVDGRVAHATIVEFLTARHAGTQVTGSSSGSMSPGTAMNAGTIALNVDAGRTSSRTAPVTTKLSMSAGIK